MANGYSYVALLDVLGYKAYVQRDRAAGSLAFKDAMTRALECLAEFSEEDIHRSAISDTIILSSPSEDGLFKLIVACRKLFIGFLQQKIFIRGGIAYSQHFKSGPVTYSHALTLAYDLESKQAVWPRILVDSAAISASKNKGFDISKKHLLLSRNNQCLVDVVLGTGWKQTYEYAHKAYKDAEKMELLGEENAFLKHALFEEYLFLHPKKSARTARYIPAFTRP